MMIEHTMAGNTVYSLQSEDNIPLFHKLSTNGLRVYDKYMEIYNRDNFSYFRTPHSMEPKSSGPGYQFEPENRELKIEFGNCICSALNTEIDIEFEIRDMWYLYQPDEDWINNPPHQHLTADYIAVMYLDMTEGDHIIFYDSDDNTENYYPNTGEILFFSGDATHKPGPSTGNRRISVNAEMNGPYPGRFTV